jgi:hypothetical protein
MGAVVGAKLSHRFSAPYPKSQRNSEKLDRTKQKKSYKFYNTFEYRPHFRRGIVYDTLDDTTLKISLNKHFHHYKGILDGKFPNIG